MFLRSFLSRTANVLIRLDADGPFGSEAAPEPKGDSLENKLTDAVSLIKNLWQKDGELLGRVTKLEGEKSTLEGQFNTATTGWENEKAEHVKTKGHLAEANTKITGLTTERDNHAKNVTRLERLCGLHGIDFSEAANVPAQDDVTSEKTPAGKWEKYQNLRKQEAEGKIEHGASFKYFQSNKAEFEKFAASKRTRSPE